MKLAETPLCEMDGCTQAAVLVHHTKRERDFKQDRLDYSLLMSVCQKHHNEIHKKDAWGNHNT